MILRRALSILRSPAIIFSRKNTICSFVPEGSSLIYGHIWQARSLIRRLSSRGWEIYVISNIDPGQDVVMLFEKLYNERNKNGLIEPQVESVLDQLAKKGAIRYVKKEKEETVK